MENNIIYYSVFLKKRPLNLPVDKLRGNVIVFLLKTELAVPL